MVHVDRRTRLADRYELDCVVGHGAMGEVWRAYDTRLDRTVAAKLFHPGAWATSQGHARFQREARLAACIAHPNVVTIHDFGIDDGLPFLVMQLMTGLTLADEIAVGPMAPARVVAVMRDVLAGLNGAHEHGVLHRDLKPGNVLFADDGRAVLGDFGIATTSDPADLTEAGVVLGTPAYLAPERLAEVPASIRSDLYSVGVMAYEALAGRKPFTGSTALEIAYAVHHASVPPVRDVRADVPPALSSVVARAMARPVDERYASAPEMCEAMVMALVRDPAGEDTVHVRTVAAPVVPAERAPAPAAARAPAYQRYSFPIMLVLVAAAFAMAALAFRHEPAPAIPDRVDTPTATVPAEDPAEAEEPAAASARDDAAAPDTTREQVSAPSEVAKAGTVATPKTPKETTPAPTVGVVTEDPAATPKAAVEPGSTTTVASTAPTTIADDDEAAGPGRNGRGKGNGKGKGKGPPGPAN